MEEPVAADGIRRVEAQNATQGLFVSRCREVRVQALDRVR